MHEIMTIRIIIRLKGFGRKSITYLETKLQCGGPSTRVDDDENMHFIVRFYHNSRVSLFRASG